MLKNYYWINNEKRRYYRIYILKDLLGDISVIRAWGSLDSNAGSQVRHSLIEQKTIDSLLERLCLQRKHRGYELITVAMLNTQ